MRQQRQELDIQNYMIGIDAFSSRRFTAWQNDQESSRSNGQPCLSALDMERICASLGRVVGFNK